MKNVPLNQFIGLPFDWIEEQRASAGGRIFQSQWSMDHSVPKIAQIDRRFKRSTYEKPKILTCGLMGCNVSWFWKLAGRLFSWLVRSPKALLLETPPRRVFRFSIFFSNFLPKKTRFFQTWGTSLQSNQVKQGQGAPPLRWPQVWENIKYFLIFLPPDSLALLLQRGFLSCTEPRWFERFFRG